jgi:hypothetical protein
MTVGHVRILFLFGVMASLASADVVGFSLSTAGSFSSGTPKDLAFSGSEFSGYSDEGGSLILGDLGTFTLTRPSQGADVYHPNSDTFTLELEFLGPLGVQGDTVFDATLQGRVNRNHGSVFIDFGPTRYFTFKNPVASGGFDLTIDDITLALPDDDSVYSLGLTGSITNAFDPPATVPEPQAVLLLGTAALLIGSAFRHRQARRR